MREKIIPLILAGGTGSRLWPLSRADRPKQFLKICGDETMLQATLRRAWKIAVQQPIIVTHADYHAIVHEQISAKHLAAQLVLEPAARGTAIAIAVAAHLALQRDADAILFVQTADHVIQNESSFHAAVAAALPAAAAGRLMTFGITPNAPDTAYGYIAADEKLTGADGCCRVERFIEKPDLARAMEFLAAGYFWNSGMFLMRADCYLDELTQYEPQIANAAATSVQTVTAHDVVRPCALAYENSPRKSIDHAVMEHTSRAGVVPCDIGWHDIGSFDALEALGKTTALHPDVLAFLADRARHAA